MNAWTSRVGLLTIAGAVVLLAGLAHGQDDASKVRALIRDLKDPDFDKAYGAAEQLRKYPQQRALIVAGLIDTITTATGIDAAATCARRSPVRSRSSKPKRPSCHSSIW